jgi:bacteriocin-like protein
MSTDTFEDPHGRALLAQAATQAGNRLQLSEQELATIIGGSDRTNGGPPLKSHQNASEKTALFLRKYQALDTLAGGDAATAVSWLRSHNTALFGRPVELKQSTAGLRDVLDTLERYRCR